MGNTTLISEIKNLHLTGGLNKPYHEVTYDKFDDLQKVGIIPSMPISSLSSELTIAITKHVLPQIETQWQAQQAQLVTSLVSELKTVLVNVVRQELAALSTSKPMQTQVESQVQVTQSEKQAYPQVEEQNSAYTHIHTPIHVESEIEPEIQVPSTQVDYLDDFYADPDEMQSLQLHNNVSSDHIQDLQLPNNIASNDSFLPSFDTLSLTAQFPESLTQELSLLPGRLV